MTYNRRFQPMRRGLCLVAALAAVLQVRPATAQTLTGEFNVIVRDSRGLVLVGAQVALSSPALIGGPKTQTTDGKGHVRVPALPPGTYSSRRGPGDVHALPSERGPARPGRDDRLARHADAEGPDSDRGGRCWFAHRHPGSRVRNALRPRGAHEHSDRTQWPLRLHRGSPRSLADLGSDQLRLRLRFGRRSEPVPGGRHECQRDE